MAVEKDRTAQPGVSATTRADGADREPLKTTSAAPSGPWRADRLPAHRHGQATETAPDRKREGRQCNLPRALTPTTPSFLSIYPPPPAFHLVFQKQWSPACRTKYQAFSRRQSACNDEAP